MIIFGIIFISFFMGSFVTKFVDMVIDGNEQGRILYLFMALFQIPILLFLVSEL